MIFKNTSFDGLDVRIEGDDIFIYPQIVGQKKGPFGTNLGVASFPFTLCELEEILIGKLNEKAYHATGSRFFGFGQSSCYEDDFHHRIAFIIRWGNSVPVSEEPDNPYHGRSHQERLEAFQEVLWEALEILENAGDFKKRVRQVRDALNKCKSLQKIERIAQILDV